MLRKNKIWRLFAIAGLMLTYMALLMYELMSIREFVLIIAGALTFTAYVEYNNKKWAGKLRRQAERFHDELWAVIFCQPWTEKEDLEMLISLGRTFQTIHKIKKCRLNPNLNNFELIEGESEIITFVPES